MLGSKLQASELGIEALCKGACAQQLSQQELLEQHLPTDQLQ